ncbi:ferritin family protein [Algiphilus aromaticivorans]|uniref:hypothetical protein n=1 Tax=Algiphilus aromaticivorans TaxID=382454 RepID=UPI0005C25913|nr:hypothetical protein [Algiphilus aromaticivorans]
MQFEQVKDVLNHVIDYHQQLSTEYGKLADEAHDPRVRMLLTYLADHEDKLRSGLEGYKTGDHSSVLNTWMQNAPDLKHPHTLDDLKGCICCATFDEVLDLAGRIHATLTDMYRSLASQAAIADEGRLFESLADRQSAENKRLSRDAARLESY